MGGNYIVKINSLCNLNCCFCADSLEARSVPDFEYRNLIKGLGENRKKFDTLIISGGEPTIYPHILKFLHHAKFVCKYKRISLTTNGLLLYKQENVDKLIKSGVDTFLISFPTSNERMYDAIVKKKGAFKLAVNGIKNVKKRNKEVRINTALHKLNYKNLANTTEFLVKLGVDAIQLSFLNPIGSSIVNGESAIALSYTEIMPYIKETFKKSNDIGFNKLYIENFPICIAPELINKISDLRKPDENKDYYNACKTKPEKCRKCSFNDICDGTWEAYLKQFGDSELKPISISESIRIAQTIKNEILVH